MFTPVIEGDYMTGVKADLSKEAIERQCDVNSCEYNGNTYIHERTVAGIIHAFKNRITELENFLATEKEYSAEAVKTCNRFADEIKTANKRIAELEAASARSQAFTIEMVDPEFVARMEYELKQNNHKGSWDNWCPPHIQLVVELLHHITKLTNALTSENKHLVAEYSADVGNLAMKTHELYGK